MTELQQNLIKKAEAYADAFGSTIDYLDPDDLQYYLNNVTPDNFDKMVIDLAKAGMFED